MSASRTLSWVAVDGRRYVDAMAVEVLLRDFAEQLEVEEFHEGAVAVRRIALAFAEIVSGKRKDVHV